MFAHVCVRAALQVSTVLLSLCLFIAVPVLQCSFSFSLPFFVIFFAFVSFLCVPFCVCMCMCESCFQRVSAGQHPCVRAYVQACVPVFTVLLSLCSSPCSK